MPALFHLLFVIAIYGAVLWIVWWALQQIPAPAPFNIVLRIIFVLIVAYVCIAILLPLADTTFVGGSSPRLFR